MRPHESPPNQNPLPVTLLLVTSPPPGNFIDMHPPIQEITKAARACRPIACALRVWLVLCLVVAASSNAFAQPGTEQKAPPKNLHVYLLIGQSNMAGRAAIPDEAGGVIDRCYLLNDKNQWEPARNPLNRYSSIGKGGGMQKLGPGDSFARKMLEQNKDISIGLIVNARGGTKIEQWLGSKPESYWGARKRTKIALHGGTLKGVLWHQGESNINTADKYLENLQSLVANLRGDFGDTDLPFVAGQVHDSPDINAQIAKIPEVAHATASVSSEGLTTTDRWHFDTKSQLLLGERYAGQMIQLQSAQEDAAAPAPRPTSDIRFIDTHVHAMAVKDGGLDAVAKWMEERNVERCIVSPLNHKGRAPGPGKSARPCSRTTARTRAGGRSATERSR